MSGLVPKGAEQIRKVVRRLSIATNALITLFRELIFNLRYITVYISRRPQHYFFGRKFKIFSLILDVIKSIFLENFPNLPFRGRRKPFSRPTVFNSSE